MSRYRTRYQQPIAWLGMSILFYTSLLPVPGMAQDAAGGLTITILEGDDAIVNIRQRVSREAIVQVDDENHKPVAGAIITFSSPSNGPSALFVNGSNTITATTNAQGRVVMSGITSNKSAGSYEIKITATKDGKTATRMMKQSNVMSASSMMTGKKPWIIGGVAAAVAVGLAVGLTRGDSNSSTPAPGVVIVPGNPTVGPPR